MVVVEEVEFAELLMGILFLQKFFDILDFVYFENWLIDQILNIFQGFLMPQNYFLVVLVQTSQILENYFTAHGFALCEVEVFDFELTLVAANQIDVFLAEHN
jgi:hypothetical protein